MPFIEFVKYPDKTLKEFLGNQDVATQKKNLFLTNRGRNSFQEC